MQKVYCRKKLIISLLSLVSGKKVEKLKRKMPTDCEVSVKKQKSNEKGSSDDFGCDFISFSADKIANSWKNHPEQSKTLHADSLYKSLNIHKLPKNLNRKSGKHKNKS